ncbi:hypothetical protein [Pelagicoccus sp. SDUM812005]|uniref:hypothetical protein n=1 Tax=Pelagicoccus sp. SDUM812005 TaxID=3041257 RepID=UPI00280C6DDE|nr:hypothetical protein [Pelagicoccus sp. SDUM812005]MDQ8181349.1 hypothetical protein [Pelagicoccus sp. SDUM812005]
MSKRVEGEEAWSEFLERLSERGAPAYVANLKAEVRSLEVGSLRLSIVYPERGYANCYVGSVRAQYVDYARYEIDSRKLGILGTILKGFLKGVDALMRLAASERTVFVNNRLLSTNLYPAGVERELAAIRDRLLGEGGERAILFRSLAGSCNAALIAALREAGFRALASREVYLLDTSSGEHRRRSNFLKDLALLEGSGLERVPGSQFSSADFDRARELYGKLYLEKYTALNPRFTEAFLREGVETGFLQLVGLRGEKGLLGVLGYYRCGDWITAPILGYDTELPVELGLYRQLTALLTLEGERLGCRIHRSSGAAAFKRSRGAKREIEYSYVYVEHLPWWRRWAWRTFLALVNRVGRFALDRIDA